MITTISPIDNKECFRCKKTPLEIINNRLNSMVIAQKTWKNTQITERINILNRFLEEIKLQTDFISNRLTIEMGRPIKYCTSEISGLLSRAEKMIQISHNILLENNFENKTHLKKKNKTRTIRHSINYSCLELSLPNFNQYLNSSTIIWECGCV